MGFQHGLGLRPLFIGGGVRRRGLRPWPLPWEWLGVLRLQGVGDPAGQDGAGEVGPGHRVGPAHHRHEKVRAHVELELLDQVDGLIPGDLFPHL